MRVCPTAEMTCFSFLTNPDFPVLRLPRLLSSLLLLLFAGPFPLTAESPPGAIWPDVLAALEVTMPYLPDGPEVLARERTRTSEAIAGARDEEEERALIEAFFTRLGLSHFSLQPRHPGDAGAPNDFSAELSEPIGHLPALPAQLEISRPRPEVLVLRFNYFMPNLMERLREAILGHAHPEHLIIFDLRDNPGGLAVMANGLAGLLTTEPFSLGTMTMPDTVLHQRVFPQPGAHTGPVVIFLNQGTASTGELFAAGLQEQSRALVIGETSAGAVLPSFLREVGEGRFILQYPVADFVTPGGVRLEGRGVIPDLAVALDGEDPERETAHLQDLALEAFGRILSAR